MSFHMCDGITGQTIDIIEDRRLNNLIKYFYYYDYKARSRVKFIIIIIDMYSPYISLIKKMFPNAQIIIDKFHLNQLISKSLNKTRIMVMKKYKKHYRKFNWKLILKSRDDLDISKWKRFTCFNPLITEADIVDFLINLDDELKQTYLAYQDLFYAIKNKNYSLLYNNFK